MTEQDKLSKAIYGTSSLESFFREENNISNRNPLLRDALLLFFALTEEQQEEFYAIIDYNENNSDVPKEDRQDMMFKMLMEINERSKNSISQISLSERQKIVEAKTIISVEEFEMKYGDSEEVQRVYRERPQNKIPYHQKVKRGKITYKVIEVDRWRENNNISNKENR
ncbi:hypothetical protein [Sulfurimonas sp.]|uniref:hypothetical protein n=1 Tax=Sulfurimonas sp. TaxID=2022749 RepID=UPI001A0DC793|nr:hypothetical protein [Sulfurimonas sp.]MBE0514079.1 hypothetical protein [Sulfurimonas sp.]